MATKSDILNNLREYTADEIVEAIKAGTVTVYELSKSGNLTPLMRRRIEERLAAKQIEASSSASGGVLSVEEAPVLNLDEASSTSNAPSNKGMFKRPFSFKGRIKRTEYCLSFLIYMIWNVVINVMMDAPEPSGGACAFVLISFIPMLWFIWAQNAKRCHDRGNSGWYQLIPFYFFVLLFGGSDEGSNEYGDNPKE